MTMPASPLVGASVGAVLPSVAYPLTRETLVRYAGASGDFNVIHWNEREAKAVGLPDVIAHGNLTMALGMRYLVELCGDPGAVREYSVRFARPVIVPDDGVGALVEISGTIGAIEDDGIVRVDLTVTSGGQKVLAQPRARIAVPSA
jgi:acyl dehydratase